MPLVLGALALCGDKSVNGKLQVSGTRIGEGERHLPIKLRHVILQFSPSVIRSILCELGFVFCLLPKCEVRRVLWYLGGQKRKHQFSKMFQVEWSVVSCSAGKKDRLLAGRSTCSLFPPALGDCRKVTWPTFTLFFKSRLSKPRERCSLQS